MLATEHRTSSNTCVVTDKQVSSLGPTLFRGKFYKFCGDFG